MLASAGGTLMLAGSSAVAPGSHRPVAFTRLPVEQREKIISRWRSGNVAVFGLFQVGHLERSICSHEKASLCTLRLKAEFSVKMQL